MKHPNRWADVDFINISCGGFNSTELAFIKKVAGETTEVTLCFLEKNL
jgi:hypothetical protein